MPSYADDVRLAHVLADNVEHTSLSLFGSPELTLDRKADGSFVSSADLQVEELIRAQLGRHRTRDAVQGEEQGCTGSGPRRWVIDPIDGTASYIRGVPVWATLIALVDEGVPVVGLVSAPALGRRWWASSGGGAFTGRSLSQARRLEVSDTEVLAHASLAYSSRRAWARAGRLESFDALTDVVWRARGYGDFWSHMLVAQGAVDVACEVGVQEHDLAALVPIVREAGGTVTDVDGLESTTTGSAVSSNSLLHKEVLERLSGASA